MNAIIIRDIRVVASKTNNMRFRTHPSSLSIVGAGYAALIVAKGSVILPIASIVSTSCG
jgi:hypothetical protein